MPTQTVPRLSWSTGPVWLLGQSFARRVRTSSGRRGTGSTRAWSPPTGCLRDLRSSANTVLCDRPSCGRKLSISRPRIRLKPFFVPAKTSPLWLLRPGSGRELSARPSATVIRSLTIADEVKQSVARADPQRAVAGAEHRLDGRARSASGVAAGTKRRRSHVEMRALSSPTKIVPLRVAHAARTVAVGRPSAGPKARTVSPLTSTRPFGVQAQTLSCGVGEQALHRVGRQAVAARVAVRLAVLNPDQAGLARADPQRAVVPFDQLRDPHVLHRQAVELRRWW